MRAADTNRETPNVENITASAFLFREYMAHSRSCSTTVEGISVFVSCLYWFENESMGTNFLRARRR